MEEDLKSIKDNFDMIKRRVEEACQKAGRDPGSVSIMAVSKMNPLEAVLAAYNAGVRLFGENRVQEALSKFEDRQRLMPEARLELIGHLQRNKARDAVAFFDSIQSVDSEKLLVELGKRAAQAEKKIDILFELHTAEDSKAGFRDRSELFDVLEKAAGMEYLVPRGLMTMAPFTDDIGMVRDSFAECREAFLACPLYGSPGWDTLSMGMSSDMDLAILEGSTLIRIGTAIFGAR